MKLRFRKAHLLALPIVVAALALALDRALPPDMSRYEDLSVQVLDREGGLLRAFTTEDDMWRLAPGDHGVDENYIRALIAYEDQRFWHHPGVDPIAIVRAFGQWAQAGRVVSGASTLTMQTARLLEPRPRTFGAKIIEAFRALQLELRYSKREILDIYLTLAPFGGNLEGVRAASLAWFGKEPAELSNAQAALLVALPQSPERLRPDRQAEAARVARDRVLSVLEDRGALSAQEAQEATEDPVPSARIAMPFHAPRLTNRLAHRSVESDTEVVRTTIAPELQAQVTRVLADHALSMEEGASIAVLVVDNATRRVVAYGGGTEFFGGEGSQIDLPRAVRSPGSTLKPFIYGLGFDVLALHPETLMDDRAMRFGNWAPQNFDGGFAGEITVRSALQQSLNVPAVAVLEEVGPHRLASRMEQVGADLTFGETGALPSLPIALGGVGISLEDLTMLYVGLANGGQVGPLEYVEGAAAAEPRRIMSDAAAWQVADILRGTPRPNGRAQAQGGLQTGDIAFKTGTSWGYRDAWAVGFTAQYTVGVWVGRPDGAPRPGRYGAGTAAPVLFDVFDHLHTDQIPSTVPDDALIVRSREELPPAMQVFVPSHMDDAAIVSAQTVQPPRIMWPPQGAQLRASHDQSLPLRASGGEAPLRWLVDGEVLESSGPFAPTRWTPEGPGFVEIAVIDANGRADRSTVRVLN